MFQTPVAFVRARGLRGLALAIALLGLVWIVTTWIVEGTSSQLILAGLEFTAGIIVVAVLRDWRSGFYLFLVWLLFENLARKYMRNNVAVYFGKDVLVGVTYIFFAARRRGQASWGSRNPV